MCGFAGFLIQNATFDMAVVARDMAKAIARRGPDDEGVWASKEDGIALSHRRLSIVDLTAAGHQPMHSTSGRFVIAYNGEIYNHAALRAEYSIRGLSNWRGHSDTETLLAGFELDGIAATLEKLTGMFAFALWDRRERKLTLARDRFGEKPVYYGWQALNKNRAFLFGSDLDALKQHPAFEGEVNPDALAQFLAYAYVPTPISIFRGLSKLEPGQILTLSVGDPEPQFNYYYDSRQAMRNGVESPFEGSPVEAVEQLSSLMKQSVARQMMADVPIGAFLSGGVDSSAVVALMQAQSSRPVKTFTIGFGDKFHNEAVFAKEVASHLGTDHQELYVTPEMALAIVPDIGSAYSEPFADSSQIPVMLVSALARKSVTVSLSGDGGDELFGGYNRYVMGAHQFGRMKKVPMPIRKLLSMALGLIGPPGWNQVEKLIKPLSGGRAGISNLATKMPKIADSLGAKTIGDLYSQLTRFHNNPYDLLNKDFAASKRMDSNYTLEAIGSDIEQMMASDLLNYLPDDILCKVDRAAMAYSLETRVPLLDQAIVEFAWSLPLNYKIREGVGKWPLRQLLYNHVPKSLIDRPKMGFSIPIDKWLRGPLRQWASDLLSSDALSKRKEFNVEAVNQIWQTHLSGRANYGHQLWPILMYRAWQA